MTNAERLRKYRQDNLSHCRERDKKRWRGDAELRARVSAYRKEYRKLHPERLKNCPSRHPDYRKNYQLLYDFGLTLEQYETMCAAQNNLCAICGKPPKNSSLAVDHCHKTKRIRGLLCVVCNRYLGRIGDDPNALKRAAAYLEAAQ